MGTNVINNINWLYILARPANQQQNLKKNILYAIKKILPPKV